MIQFEINNKVIEGYYTVVFPHGSSKFFVSYEMIKRWYKIEDNDLHETIKNYNGEFILNNKSREVICFKDGEGAENFAEVLRSYEIANSIVGKQCESI